MRFGKKKADVKNNILRTGILLSALLLGPLFCQHRALAAARDLNVETHTQEEIIEYVESHEKSGSLTYTQDPATTAPYSAGALSAKTQQDALDTLNEVRYIAGLSYDVTTDATYISQAQTGALVNYANDKLSHFPSQPEGMDKAMYDLGCIGTEKGNISWSSELQTLEEAILNGWMADQQPGNIATVGHRRWCLNPAMGKTGFGAVYGKNGTYGVMYAHDQSRQVSVQPTVVWPARNMPTEYFAADYPWSISSKTAFSDNVSVKVTRTGDNQVWNFSSTSADGYFNYNKQGYGQPYCLIFRPSGITGYYAGDEYHVQVMENQQATLDYTVTFFDVEKIPAGTTITLSSTSGKVSVSENEYWGMARVSLSDPSISMDKISISSSDESVAQAFLKNSILFIRGLKDGVAAITLSLSRDITATFYVTVGTGGNHTHTYSTDYVIEIEPTCTTAGRKYRYCTGCGVKTDITEISATGHSYGEWVVTKEASCEAAGVKESTCSVCGEKKTEEIPATGHDWDGGTVQKEATEKETGIKIYTCRHCKKVRSESIPATGKNEQPGRTEPNVPAVGSIVTDEKTGGIYRTTSSGTVEYQGAADKNASSVTVPQSVTLNGVSYQVTAIAANACKGSKKLAKVVIGSSVTSIGANAFSGCSRLKSVTLGKKVTAIGSKAFYKCTSLTKITIPASVASIGKQAFGGCKKLKSITIKTKKLTAKNVGGKAFKGIHAKAVIKVPKAKLKTYKKLLQAKGAGKSAKMKK